MSGPGTRPRIRWRPGRLPLHDADLVPWLFWPSAALGAAVVGYGLVRWSFWDSSVDVGTYLRWTVGLAVAHDLVLAPAVGLLGLALARLVRPPYRAPLQAGLIVAGVVTVFSVPFVRGWGRSANTSALPRNYAHGLLAVLAVIAVATGAALVRAWWLGRRRGDHGA